MCGRGGGEGGGGGWEGCLRGQALYVLGIHS